MLSWPTGGGHGRSLITLISTASVTKEEMEEKRGKQQATAKGVKRDMQ